MFSAIEMKNRLLLAGLATADQIRGCTSEEVAAMENKFGIAFPNAYKEFLYLFGRHSGSFWSDVEYSFDQLERINHEANDILVSFEEFNLQLPHHSFVFSTRRGEQFLFFISDGKSEDPPIFHFLIGYSEFKKCSDTFWSGIEGELIELELIRRDIPQGMFPWIK